MIKKSIIKIRYISFSILIILSFYFLSAEVNTDKIFPLLANEFFHLRLNQNNKINYFALIERTGKKSFNVIMEVNDFDVDEFYNKKLMTNGWIKSKNQNNSKDIFEKQDLKLEVLKKNRNIEIIIFTFRS